MLNYATHSTEAMAHSQGGALGPEDPWLDEFGGRMEVPRNSTRLEPKYKSIGCGATHVQPELKSVYFYVWHQDRLLY